MDETPIEQTPHLGFHKGAAGGCIYIDNSHHSAPGRIDYVFPNATTHEDWVKCQEAINHIEKCVNAYEKNFKAFNDAIDAIRDGQSQLATRILGEALGYEPRSEN